MKNQEEEALRKRIRAMFAEMERQGIVRPTGANAQAAAEENTASDDDAQAKNVEKETASEEHDQGGNEEDETTSDVKDQADDGKDDNVSNPDGGISLVGLAEALPSPSDTVTKPEQSATTSDVDKSPDDSIASEMPDLDSSDTASVDNDFVDAEEHFPEGEFDNDTETLKNLNYAKHLQEALDKKKYPVDEPVFDPEISLDPEGLKLRELSMQVEAEEIEAQIAKDHEIAKHLGQCEELKQASYEEKHHHKPNWFKGGSLCRCWKCEPGKEW